MMIVGPGEAHVIQTQRLPNLPPDPIVRDADVVQGYLTDESGELPGEAAGVVRIATDSGEGWSECVAPREPFYASEWVGGAHAVMAMNRHTRAATRPPKYARLNAVSVCSGGGLCLC